MIKKNLLKIILTATVAATLLTATACGSSQTSDNNTTVQQTTEAVKVVSNVDVKTEAGKSNEEADKLKEEAEKQPEQLEEAKEEQPAENAEAVNTEAENAGEINEAQNTVSEEVQEAQAEPEATPAEDTNTGWVDTTPVEQPVEVEEAPAEDTNSGAVEETPVEQPAEEQTPELVVTQQEPEKPSVTEEQQVVATGKWVKEKEWESTTDGSICSKYKFTDPYTGYSLWASFKNGTNYLMQANSPDEVKAIYNAHGIDTNSVTGIDILLQISNS